MLKSGQLKNLPNRPGVYLFRRGREILYVGKATNLRNRIKSYLSKDLRQTRGEWLVKMTQEATGVDFHLTGSVLEALILEAGLIKKYQPAFNTRDKDDSSFSFVVITKEEYPRVLLIRGKDLTKGEYHNGKIFGPFPHANEIRTALKLVRKIFPFRDKCVPESGRACFNYQIGLCAGVCVGALGEMAYKKIIKQLKLFFAGKKNSLLRNLRQEMQMLARAQEFEQAAVVKKRLFALQHIQDVALIKPENVSENFVDRDNDLARQGGAENKFRIEAYDIAHLAGQNAVGVMVVLEGGELAPEQYRKFKLRIAKPGDDLAGLREILIRRFNHPGWRMPDLIVIDGGKAQLNLARKILQKHNFQNIKLVSVVKDEKHKAREILGDSSTPLGTGKKLINKLKRDLIKINHEAHRFAIAYHRQKRRKAMF